MYTYLGYLDNNAIRLGQVYKTTMKNWKYSKTKGKTQDDFVKKMMPMTGSSGVSGSRSEGRNPLLDSRNLTNLKPHIL